MLFAKTIHFFFVIAWFSGLFYLPRLFVYHATTKDDEGYHRFCIMEHKLFFYIMSPSAFLAVSSGLVLWFYRGFEYEGWLLLKLFLVLLLILYHGWCYRELGRFSAKHGVSSDRYYRWMNEIPSFLLFGILMLAVIKYPI